MVSFPLNDLPANGFPANGLPASGLPANDKGLRLCLRWLCLSVPLAMSCASLAQAGKTMLVEPPAPLLPAKLGEFAKASPAAVGDGLGTVDPAESPVLQEDGIRRFERSDYNAGASHGTLTAYQFMDASGAYAAFCFHRRSDGNAAAKRLGDIAVGGRDGVIFQSGINLVVARFDLPVAKTDALLTELIPRLPKVAGPAANPPLLPTYLPAKGLVASSIRYALGPNAYTAMGGVLPVTAIDFARSGEVITAEYLTHGSQGPKGMLTLLLYPTPTIAGDAGRAIEDQYRANPASLGTAKLRREGPMLMLATGGFSDAEAQQMVDGIHLRNELTWNKQMPLEFHSEVKKTASLLTSIMVFSGVAGLAAILLGLFLGFGRAGIRVLMGKPAASEPEFLRIDLSGGPAGGLRGALGDERTGSPGTS